jgi:hypothetical protein
MRFERRVSTALTLLTAAALLTACPAARDVRPDPAPETPEPAPPTLEDQVAALFEAFGLEGEVQDLMRTTLEFYATLLQILPPEAMEAREVAAARIETVVAAEHLVASARAYMIENGDADRLGEILAFNETPAGRQWAEATSRIKYDADDPEAWLTAFYAGLDADPDARTRLERVRELEGVSGHGRKSIGMVLKLAGLFLDGFQGLPEAIQPAAEHIASVRGNLEQAMAAPMMDELLVGSYLYATRDMSLDEIEAVIAFHVDGPGAWYAELLAGGLLAAATDFVEALVGNLATAYGEVASG